MFTEDAVSYPTEFISTEFQSEDGKGYIELQYREMRIGGTPEELAEMVQDELVGPLLEEPLNLVEITPFQKRQDDAREYYQFSYRIQASSEECIIDGSGRIMLSDLYYSKLYGFVLLGGACEDSLDLYGDELDAMLESFDP